MKSSESSGGKVFGRFAEPAHQVLDLARRKPGGMATATSAPERMALLGTLVEGQSHRPPSCSGRSTT